MKENELDNAKVGDGATYTIATDSQAGTIIKRTPKTIIWQRDVAKLLNGVDSGEPDALHFSPGGFVGHTSGRQRHEFSPDPDGQRIKFSRRANGAWKVAGHRTTSRGCYLSAGRHEHYDFNF
jgi:hypothetical protein